MLVAGTCYTRLLHVGESSRNKIKQRIRCQLSIFLHSHWQGSRLGMSFFDIILRRRRVNPFHCVEHTVQNSEGAQRTSRKYLSASHRVADPNATRAPISFPVAKSRPSNDIRPAFSSHDNERTDNRSYYFYADMTTFYSRVPLYCLHCYPCFFTHS